MKDLKNLKVSQEREAKHYGILIIIVLALLVTADAVADFVVRIL